MSSSQDAGNSAAMREALEWIAHYTDDRYNMDDPRCADGHILADKAKAALAVPPRNCDRFDSYVRARKEWWKSEVLPRVEGVISGAEPPFENWLFLPATEQKGEADGSK